MKDLTHSTITALLDHCPAALLLIDSTGQIRGYNQAFSGLVGEAAATLEGDAQANALIAPLLGTTGPISWIMPDGDQRWLSTESVVLDESPAITACYYQDVTEKLRLKNERDGLQAELARQALHDALLPGLLSRLGLQISLQPLVSRARRYNNPLSLLGIGIDSAEAGEALRKKVSFLLKDQTRWADLVGCNDQHDFILILQETTQDAAMQLIDKLATRLAAMGISTRGEPRVGFGLTQCQRDDDADSMLARTESAIVEARNNDSGIAIAV